MFFNIFFIIIIFVFFDMQYLLFKISGTYVIVQVFIYYLFTFHVFTFYSSLIALPSIF